MNQARQLADALAGVGARVTITEEEFIRSPLMRPQLICKKLRDAGAPVNGPDDMEMYMEIRVERGRLDVTVIPGGSGLEYGLEYTWLL